VVANLIQTGPILSLYPLKPDLTRLNPARGIKKLFSTKSLFDLGRMLAKLFVLGFVVYHSLKGLVPQFFIIQGLSPSGYVRTLLDSLAGMGLKISIALGVIALVDLIYVKRRFAKQMRMSGREMKDENKQREGDPRIRSRLRKLRMEMRKRTQAVGNTSQADVIITNPTHLAVALRYEHGAMTSPQLVAKGAGTVAAMMRQIAARKNIPVVQNPPLARKLYKQVDFDQHVPESLYADVARIIVWVFAMKQAHAARNAAGARP
jgi:flagellar biosynthetic protein FlhB